MKIQENMLVIILEQKGRPPKNCWGLVKQVLPKNDYLVFIEKVPLEGVEGFYPREINIASEQLVPVVATDGDEKEPLAALRRNVDGVVIKLFCLLSSQKEGASALPNVRVNTLVAVPKPGGLAGEKSLGVVCKVMPDGKLDVVVCQPRALLPIPARRKIIVPPDQAIVILELEKPAKFPRKALLTNLPHILMQLYLQLFTEKGQEALARLILATKGHRP